MLGCTHTHTHMRGPVGAWWARGAWGRVVKRVSGPRFKRQLNCHPSLSSGPLHSLPHHLTVPEAPSLVPSHTTPPPPFSPVTNTPSLSHTPLHPQKLSTPSTIPATFILCTNLNRFPKLSGWKCSNFAFISVSVIPQVLIPVCAWWVLLAVQVCGSWWCLQGSSLELLTSCSSRNCISTMWVVMAAHAVGPVFDLVKLWVLI